MWWSWWNIVAFSGCNRLQMHYFLQDEQPLLCQELHRWAAFVYVLTTKALPKGLLLLLLLAFCNRQCCAAGPACGV